MPKQETKDNEVLGNGNIADTLPIVVNFDFDESAWIQETTIKAVNAKLTKTEQAFNTVTWKSGNSGKVQVSRLIAETVDKINAAHEFTRINGKEISLERVYVAKFATVYNGEKISKTLGAIGIAQGTAYLLTSSYNFAVQSNGGENIDTLHNMIATVKKAIMLAQKHGIYDANNMVHDNTETVIRSKPIVSTESDSAI